MGVSQWCDAYARFVWIFPRSHASRRRFLRRFRKPFESVESSQAVNVSASETDAEGILIPLVGAGVEVRLDRDNGGLDTFCDVTLEQIARVKVVEEALDEVGGMRTAELAESFFYTKDECGGKEIIDEMVGKL